MKRHLFRRMGRFLRPQAPSLAGAAALAALSGLLALLVPLVAGWAVEAIGTGPGAADLTAVLRYCAAGLGAAVLSAVCSYGASAALVRVGQTVSYTLRKAAFQQITQLPVRYFDTHPAGDLISRVCYDVDTVNAALSTDLLQIGTSLLTVIGSFVMLLMLSPLLSGVFFLTVPLSVLLTRLQMKHIHPLFRRRSQELGALNSFAEERVSCQRAIRVYGVEAADLRQFAEKNDAASETYYKADCASTALGPSVNFINNLSLAAVSVFGALLYLGGGLSLGALSSFVLYSRKFSGPIRETAELLSDLQASVAAAERVLDLLDQPAEDGDLPGAREPCKLSGAISFRHVDFGYDPAHPVLRDFSADIPSGSMVAAAERVLDLLDQPAEDGDLPGAREPCKLSGAISFRHVDFGYDPAHPVLRDFSADIPAGSMVAVVGPTGAGKTTLVSLLLRFYTPQSGTITIDGLPIQQYTRDGLRRRLAIVLQDGWLCGGTIAENIAYGVPGATRAQIEAAAKAACIHSFLSSLPDGYDTALTDSGAGLSKGQRQLLALARCFLSNADIVILDEATSDVDPETEEQISAALERLRRGRTCFLIAHRLATVRTADRILVLQDGRIAEQGTHQQLLDAGGIYRVLYDAQFS